MTGLAGFSRSAPQNQDGKPCTSLLESNAHVRLTDKGNLTRLEQGGKLKEMLKRSATPVQFMLLVGLLASSLALAPARAQSAQDKEKPVAPVGQPTGTATPTHYRPSRFSKRATEYYGLVWGIDSLSVKSVESGEMIRFSYRVLDPEKAKVLNDKKVEPFLADPQAGVKLVIPTLEKVGQLRQSSTPEAGKSYWMAFSNKGRFVKPGDHVTVVIGQFRANGLVIE